MNTILKNNSFNIGVLIWICLLTIMVLLIIIIGGLTRLTDSGLSIVDWKPFMGIFPPLTDQAWIDIFSKYKVTPEFIIVNSSMSLDEFKFIFWWEWFHRFIARCIGLIFVLPLIYFFLRKKLSSNLIFMLFFVFIFGLFQGIVGWWLVKSGMEDNPYVSAYILAFHLTNALIIFSILFWLSLSIYFGKEKKDNIIKYVKIFFQISLFLILLTIISGAFMAGTDAGKSFNTFPLMTGKFIPDGYYLNEYGWKNFFENTIAINFNHRWLAVFTFIIISSFVGFLLTSKKNSYNKFSLYLVLIVLLFQLFLGIITLIYKVPISFASLHQTNSVFLLASTIFAYHRLIYK